MGIKIYVVVLLLVSGVIVDVTVLGLVGGAPGGETFTRFELV